MNEKIGMRVNYYEQPSDRIIIAKIGTKPTLVQVYMPTSSADDEEIKEIYDELKEIIQTVKGEENLIVMGDLNSAVGKGREGAAAFSVVIGATVWMIDWAGLVTSANVALPHSYCEWLKARGNYSRYFSRGHAALLYENMMIASSRVKYSGGKIVPHSDFRAGTTQEDVITRKGNISILQIGAWNVRSL